MVAALHAQAALGRDDDLVTARARPQLERLAEQPLGLAEPVGLRGVEEVDAEVERPPGGRRRLVLLHAPQSPPVCQVPKQMRETSRSVWPSRVYRTSPPPVVVRRKGPAPVPAADRLSTAFRAAFKPDLSVGEPTEGALRQARAGDRRRRPVA